MNVSTTLPGSREMPCCPLCGAELTDRHRDITCANCDESLSAPLRNPQRLVARILWGITLAMGALMVYALFRFDPVTRWLVIGLTALALLMALICQYVMVPRVERMLQELRSDAVLIRWVYTPQEWDLWKQISRDEWSHRIRSDRREALISRNAVYIDDRFESWNLSFNFNLESVSLEEGRISWIEITFSWTSGSHITHRTIRVPVPESQRVAARDVIAELSSGR